MAEQVHKTKQYQYTANSNLVLQADRSLLPRREQEPTGEPESLYGRMCMDKFGDLAKRPGDAKDQLPKQQKRAKSSRSSSRKGHSALPIGGNDVLSATQGYDAEDIYRPKTKETAAVFELILSFIQGYLGAISPDILRSAANEVLCILKDDSLKDLDKKKRVEETISETIPHENFAQLVNLGKRIVDFKQSGDDNEKDGIDEDHGVAVIFDENDESESGSSHTSINDAVSDIDEDDGSVKSDNYDTDKPYFEDKSQDGSSMFFTTDIKNESQKGSKQNEDITVDPHSVDAFWLQRTISNYYSDAHMSQEKASKALEILSSNVSVRDCENALMMLLDYDKFDLLKLLIKNRDIIVWCTKLSRAGTSQEKSEIETQMNNLNLGWVLSKLKIAPTREVNEQQRRGVVEIDSSIDSKRNTEAMDYVNSGAEEDVYIPKILQNIESLAFSEGGHLMSNKKCFLPPGTVKKDKNGYQEIHIPAPNSPTTNDPIVPVSKLPAWAQKAFPNTREFNRVQSRVYNAAFETDENMLICAPTGSGKTNCAMLAMLREIGKYLTEDSLKVDEFKIVYVAPIKALVAEIVKKFSTTLEPYGIKVSELTGDTSLTKKTINESQVIVATPEKWDVVTRKDNNRICLNIITLLVIDEIHLLHDDRGPVLESIVARLVRSMSNNTCETRIIGLSATLPNYTDVAKFIRAHPQNGTFFFDNSYRPCPLKQQYIGIGEKKAMARYRLMNEIVYNKVREASGRNQVLVFCHSRKDTARTARSIRDTAVSEDTIAQILGQNAASREILQTEAETTNNQDLKELIPHGFAIHHAGMKRADRTLVEELFSGGHIRVLVSTATLAWGVNLPAHTVIIKWTQVYNPEKGKWVELSPQDILQMLGRAGRPQFDTFGEGIIITSHSELQYYLSLLNQQLPIESQFMSKIQDNLNAEIVLGFVKNMDDAVKWLGYTYFYIRMIKNPTLYGIKQEDLEKDPYLVRRRTDLVHTAAVHLEKCNLLKYDKKTGAFQTTELGRIASHYYVSHHSILMYNQHLRPTMTLSDILRVFSLSHEFKYINVREEEKLEIAKLLEKVPIPIKENATDRISKVNVLLQCYISQLKLEGFSLVSDMVYIVQNANRIFRAIFEICLRRGWAMLTLQALNMCKIVEHRMWMSACPLRQIRGFPLAVIKRLERKEFPWTKYFDLNPQELGELSGTNAGKIIYKAVHKFPKLDLQVHVQPLTKSMLRFELTVTPDFQFDEKISPSGTEVFWIIVENCDRDTILYHDIFILKKQYIEEDHSLVFTVPLFEPMPPCYYVTLVSDTWLHCEVTLPVVFKNLVLPDKRPLYTELLDLQPLPISALDNPEYESIYKDITRFNPIETQVFNALFNTDDNVFIGAPPGSGKTVCAEFALLRLWSLKQKSRCVFVAPFHDVVEYRLKEWKKKLSHICGGKNLVALTGEVSTDLKLLEVGDVIFTTPRNWDVLSRRWKQRKNVQMINLFIVSDIHLVGGSIGPTLEIVISRMRYISAQTERPIRIIALGISLANVQDVGEWIGTGSIFNFKASTRLVPLEVHVQGYPVSQSFTNTMSSLVKPTQQALEQASKSSSIIFVSSRKQAQITAAELLIHFKGSQKKFPDEYQKYIDMISDNDLKNLVPYGLAFYHEILSQLDRKIIEELYEMKLIRVIIASRETCWGMPLKSSFVEIMGTQYYEGKEHMYVDYTIAEVLQMVGVATQYSQGDACKCLIICQNTKKEFYKKFLYEAPPVESHLDQYLHDHFNAEIVTKIIENKQDAVDYLTWTLFYRRISQNPNYYNIRGISNRHLSEHLSELVENTIDDLANSKCISVNDTEVSPLNLGLIAAYYYTNYVTIELFSMNLSPKFKIRSLLQVISAAAEFEDIPIRHSEEKVLRKIYECVPIKTESPNFNDPHLKTHILLQAHFMRLKFTPDLEYDLSTILKIIISLVQCIVDVISSNCWLSSSIASMELSQMIVQAVWNYDSPLKQIPHFTPEIISKFKEKGVESVLDVIDMEDGERLEVMKGLTKRQISEVADFVNKYPNIDVTFEVPGGEVEPGGDSYVTVSLERDIGEEEVDYETLEVVNAPLYPAKKHEGWWLVMGIEQNNMLLAIKRVTIKVKEVIKLEFSIPDEVKPGPLACKLYLFSDSYVGVDQEYEVNVNVSQSSNMEMDK